jgi:hypothetical protein
MLRFVFRRVIRPLGHQLGIEVSRYQPPASTSSYPVDFTPTDIRILEQVRPFTMTTNENTKVLMDAVRYISAGGSQVPSWNAASGEAAPPWQPR